jgi:hypothetical protein
MYEYGTNNIGANMIGEASISEEKSVGGIPLCKTVNYPLNRRNVANGLDLLADINDGMIDAGQQFPAAWFHSARSLTAFCRILKTARFGPFHLQKSCAMNNSGLMQTYFPS